MVCGEGTAWAARAELFVAEPVLVAEPVAADSGRGHSGGRAGGLAGKLVECRGISVLDASMYSRILYESTNCQER
jgi:hypothetical protein